MKNKLIIILGIVIALLIIASLVVFTNKNNELNSKIINYIDSNNLKVINIADVTDFDWDTMLVFEHKVTNNEISQALGINYTKGLDLSYGMIFVKNGKVVYEERFKNVGYKEETPFKFKIDIDKDVNQHFEMFDKDTATFRIDIFDYNGTNCYKLWPYVKMISTEEKDLFGTWEATKFYDNGEENSLEWMRMTGTLNIYGLTFKEDFTFNKSLILSNKHIINKNGTYSIIGGGTVVLTYDNGETETMLIERHNDKLVLEIDEIIKEFSQNNIRVCFELSSY